MVNRLIHGKSKIQTCIELVIEDDCLDESFIVLLCFWTITKSKTN